MLEKVPVCFVFLVSIIGCHNLNIVNTLPCILKFSGKKYSLALHLVEKDTDPDLHPGPADLIRLNDTDPTESGS